MVHETMQANGTIWEGIPAIVSTVQNFSDKLSLLETKDQQQRTITIGVRGNADQMRENSIDEILRFANALKAYGKASGNSILVDQMSVKRYKLSKGSKEDFITLLTIIIDVTVEHGIHLLDYGITQAEIDLLPIMRETVYNGVYSTRKAINERKEATFKMYLLETEIDALLKDELDALMIVLKSAHPEFYRAYGSSRAILEFGNGHSSPNS
jgi:hypothetical protein